MANYCCAIRTNYFHVNDEEGFRGFMSGVAGCEDSVDLWEKKDLSGNTLFAFGTYGGISGVINPTEDADDEADDDAAYDAFIEGLQKFVAKDDAIILLEAGNEKLRYVIGSALVITKDGTEYFNITDTAVQIAKEKLGNPDWTTCCNY